MLGARKLAPKERAHVRSREDIVHFIDRRLPMPECDQERTHIWCDE
jgi:hypothetical protein